MSLAPCLADTNNLALDPATTAEDTQHTRQSIISYTGSVFCSVSVSPSVLLPHCFLSLMPIFCPPFTSVIKVSYLIPLRYQRCNLSQSPLPQTLSMPLICLRAPSNHSIPLNYSPCPSQSLSPCLPLSLFPPSSSPFLSLSLSSQPTASLSLGRDKQCQPTWGPSAVPAEKAGSTREHP